jgi:hypothetical protein
MHDAL